MQRKPKDILVNTILTSIHGEHDNHVKYSHRTFISSLLLPQIYPDEGHSLEGVKRHLYRTMSAFLDDCFRKQVPPETKAGLRNGGNLD